MINFLNRKKKENSFKKNTREFWQWFSKNSETLYQQLKDGKSAELAEEMIRQVNKLMPGMAWCFGPGISEGRFSFTLSPEANRNFQFLTSFWLDMAPEIPNWDFYSARQPSAEPENYSIAIRNREFSIGEMWLKPQIDEKNQVFDISVWHPHFHEMDDNARFQVLFLWLDEVLGEIGTEQWIGQVDFSTEEFAEAIPLLELPDFVAKQQAELEWKKPPPEESYSLYEISLDEDEFPRSDTKFGNTCHMQLIGDYFDTKGDMPNPLSGSLADYVYVTIPTSFFPVGNEINTRTKIEDKLNSILRENKAGRSIGSAFGSRNNYLDFIIFDGDQSLEILLNAMISCELPAGCEVRYWAAENEDVFSI